MGKTSKKKYIDVAAIAGRNADNVRMLMMEKDFITLMTAAIKGDPSLNFTLHDPDMLSSLSKGERT